MTMHDNGKLTIACKNRGVLHVCSKVYNTNLLFATFLCGRYITIVVG